jgi:pimeloyl-ACP methyl ester carboxylesterase
MSNGEGQTINVRGVNHYYEWICKPTNSLLKPIMVFIHGWGGSARYWRSTANALSDRFDCLLYDLRGFGRSSLPSVPSNPSLTYELEDYADDLAALLDALQLDVVYLHAHSMGASVATLFFNRYPARVKRVILTCSSIFMCSEKVFSSFYQAVSYAVRFRSNWFLQVPFADKFFMTHLLYRPIPRRDSLAFFEDYLSADYEAVVGTMYSAVSKKAAKEMPPKIAQISVPTLMISGEKDIVALAAMGKQMAALNEKIEFFKIPRTAHFPMLEDPPTYLKKVKGFLGNEQPS